MRKWIFALFINMMMFQLWAQGNYYIYIQSEDNQPFYVKYGSRVLESSGNGDIVLSNLSGGSCEFFIGFPEKAGVEWKFNCATAETDQVYILRTSNSKAIELSILKQGKNIAGIKVESANTRLTAAQEKKATGVISDDPFSAMLAQVVNDPTIRQQPVIIPKPGDSLNNIAKAVKKDSVNTLIAVADKQPGLKKEEKTAAKKDSLPAEVKINKDSINALVAAVDKKAEVKKDEKISEKADSSSTIAKADKKEIKASLKPDNSVIINKPTKKDTVNALIASVAKKEDKAQAKIDSSAIIKTGKKDTDSAALVVTDKKPEIKKEEKIIAKPDSNVIAKTTVPATKQDNNITKAQPTTNTPPGTWLPVEKKSIVRSSNIKRTLQRKSNDGIELIYIDELTDGTKDTIRILIPATP
ncbi:MAG: hypothetical protein QM768_07280 [Agriterribacter sp.]